MIVNKSQEIYCINYLGSKKYTKIEVFIPTKLTTVNLKEVYEYCKQDVAKRCKVKRKKVIATKQPAYSHPIYMGNNVQANPMYAVYYD